MSLLAACLPLPHRQPSSPEHSHLRALGCCGLGQDGKDKIVSSDEPGATRVGSLQSTQCASAGGAMGRQLDLHPFFIGLIVSADTDTMLAKLGGLMKPPEAH